METTYESKMTAVKTPSAGKPPAPSSLPVRAGEPPWTGAEVDALRAELEADVVRLTAELAASEQDLEGLMRDYGGGAGDDSADTGGKVLEREQGLTLTQNSRTLLEQTQRALQRILDGQYGSCESCGESIGKMRLQAFPRATFCVACKQRQERR